jgi:UDP-N-acetylmuramoylalanine--D-glutamate ligase
VSSGSSFEVAVIGMGRSGSAVAELLSREGYRVYASDVGGPLDEQLAERLSNRGVEVETGGHDLERIARASLVVTSPGVPPDAAPLEQARQSRVPIVSEIEIALRHMRGTRIIAITGTNGKSTTTALIAHLLLALGHRAAEGGNIGTPLSSLALADEPPGWVALEISSFQLHDTPSIAPQVGVLTNLSPDHLDRYPGIAEYYADKRLLFRNAAPGMHWVVNGDQREVLGMVDRIAGETHRFSINGIEGDAWYDRDAGRLMLLGEPLLQRDALPLLGDHNVANALAASLAVMVADPAHASVEARERLAEGLRTFQALSHRMEVVGEFDGVLWINDSKATNVSSSRVAIEGMTRPTVVLLGGRHKGEPYTALADPLRAHARAVVAYGEAGARVERDLGNTVPVHLERGNFAAVVARARKLAQRGDAVLLTPACSSFDMFRNYEERGDTFRRLAAHRGDG